MIIFAINPAFWLNQRNLFLILNVGEVMTGQLNHIKEKVVSLLAEKKRLQDENARLHNVVNEQSTVNLSLQTEVEQLKNELTVLRERSNGGSLGREEIKAQINKLVQEIDQCIAKIN